MKVICWNIQKNNATNIRADLICEALKTTLKPGEPWLLAILENKSGGDSVGQTLCTGLNGSWFHTAPAGGGTHTQENVVLVGGNCDYRGHASDTSWQAMFGGAFNLQYFSHVSAVEAQAQNSRSRATTHQATVATARRETPWEPSNCRNPVLVEINDGSRNYRFGFVHSPGPQEGVSYSDYTYAQSYFSCIMESLQHQGLDGLMGDFNIYGSEPARVDGGALQDVSFDLGGTTFKKATASVGNSRLDRAYLTSRYALHSQLGLVNGTIDASDHVGVWVDLATCGDCLHALSEAAEQASDGWQHLMAPVSAASSSTSNAMDLS